MKSLITILTVVGLAIMFSEAVIFAVEEADRIINWRGKRL